MHPRDTQVAKYHAFFKAKIGCKPKRIRCTREEAQEFVDAMNDRIMRGADAAAPAIAELKYLGVPILDRQGRPYILRNGELE